MKSVAQLDKTAWKHTQIISVVTVIDGAAAQPRQALQRLHAGIVSLSAPFEIVAVLNGCSAHAVSELRALALQLTDLQFYQLQYPVDRDTAMLAGLDCAVGDWIACLALESDDPQAVNQLFYAAVAARAEVALPVYKAPRHTAVWRQWGSWLFHRLFTSMHGFDLVAATPSARLVSRSVINAVLQHDSPLVALATLATTAGYRQVHVDTAAPKSAPMPLAQTVRSRWRLLIGVSRAPLRLANIFCGGGAFLATLYSLYVVAVYLSKPDVMPGWTTMSLMLSGMFFMVSVVLALLSETMILLLDGGARRPRYQTAEEFASPAQSRRRYLNVEAD